MKSYVEECTASKLSFQNVFLGGISTAKDLVFHYNVVVGFFFFFKYLWKPGQSFCKMKQEIVERGTDRDRDRDSW